MSIFDSIMALTRRDDPAEKMKQAILAQNQSVQPVQAGADGGGQPGPQQDPNSQVPKAYESPPDLSAMYLELVNRDRNAVEMDQGMTLIAAGLARDENRDRIMSTYPDTPKGTESSMFNTLGLLQKQQQELLVKNQLRLAIPRIAKEHGLSLEDAYMLFETGQLEEFLKSADAPSYVTITDEFGRQRIVDQRDLLRNKPDAAAAPTKAAPELPPPAFAEDNTPQPVLRSDVPDLTNPPDTTVPDYPGVEVSGPARRKIIKIPDPSGKGGEIAVYEDDYTRVDTGEKVTKIAAPPRKIIQVEDPSGKGGKVSVYEDDYTRVDTGEKITAIKAPPRKVTFIDDPESTGQIATYDDGTRAPELDIPGGEDLEFRQNADGQTQAYNKNTGKEVGKPMGPTTDVSTDDMKEWAKASAEAEARGETFPPWDEWLKTLTAKRDPKPPSANMDPKTGILWPDPPPDMVYAHNPDGSFIMDPTTNTPKVIDMPGSKKAIEAAAVKEKEQAQVESKQQAANTVSGMVDKAIGIMEDETWYNPATGAYAPLFGLLEGWNRAQLEESLNPIKASVAFDALADMRRNSPTGGALGNVSDIELRLLASTLGSLEPRQGAESLKENLRLIKEIVGNNSQKALDEWRAKYNPKGKNMTPEEKAAVDKAYDDNKAAAEAPAATEPPAGAKRFRIVNGKKVPVE